MAEISNFYSISRKKTTEKLQISLKISPYGIYRETDSYNSPQFLLIENLKFLTEIIEKLAIYQHENLHFQFFIREIIDKLLIYQQGKFSTVNF